MSVYANASQREQALALSTARQMKSKFSDSMEKRMLDGTYDDDTFKNIGRLDDSLEKHDSRLEMRDERKKERQFGRDQRAFQMKSQHEKNMQQTKSQHEKDMQRGSDTVANENIREAGMQRKIGIQEAQKDREHQKGMFSLQKGENEANRAFQRASDQARLNAQMNIAEASRSGRSGESALERGHQKEMLNIQLGHDRWKTIMGESRPSPLTSRYWG